MTERPSWENYYRGEREGEQVHILHVKPDYPHFNWVIFKVASPFHSNFSIGASSPLSHTAAALVTAGSSGIVHLLHWFLKPFSS